MGGNQAAEEVDTPKQGKPVGSMALTLFGNENLSVGEPWSTGLFDCHENQTNAIVTACLPCITFGQIAEILDGGEMTCPLGTFIYMLMMPPLSSQWIMGSKYRTKLRKKYGLVEAPYEDTISHVLCPCCSLSQEFRELKNRGFDPTLVFGCGIYGGIKETTICGGWNGVLAQQKEGKYQEQEFNSPPSNQRMSK